MIDLKELRKLTYGDKYATGMLSTELIELLNRLEAAENESKQWQESYSKLNTQGERLLAKIDDECCKMHERLKAAEKVCDAVKMFSLQVPHQSNKNGIAMWGEIDNALKKWQEVKR